MTLVEYKRLTVKEMFHDLCMYKFPCDFVTEDMPYDIDKYTKTYEIINHELHESYIWWIKSIELDDHILFYAFLETQIHG